jgi:hypothetical protein
LVQERIFRIFRLVRSRFIILAIVPESVRAISIMPLNQHMMPHVKYKRFFPYSYPVYIHIRRISADMKLRACQFLTRPLSFSSYHLYSCRSLPTTGNAPCCLQALSCRPPASRSFRWSAPPFPPAQLSYWKSPPWMPHYLSQDASAPRCSG